MLLTRIKIIEVPHRPLLNDLEIKFSQEDDATLTYPNILIGVNGSGKSQLLETIAEIFLYLDRLFRPINRTIVNTSPLLFEIDYILTIRNKKFFVFVKQNAKKGKSPEIEVIDENEEEIELSIDNFDEYLPQKIIGYTSGDNETLSLPFTEYYDEYADYTARRALKEESKKLGDYEPRFYLMDYNTNIGVVIANLILGKTSKMDLLLGKIGVSCLKSFQIIIQTKHKAAPGTIGIELTEELDMWIDQLKNAATCFQYFRVENKYVLDFYINAATKDALDFYFGSSIKFYTALYKIELLNNLIIKKAHREAIKQQRSNRRLITKPPTVADQDKVLNYSEIKLELVSGDIVDYLSLSDGEHQLLNIFGTIIMTEFPNCLYLLDEPETHFNPKWRREFISLLSELIKDRKQDYFLTSHSPFIVADSKRDKVYIFRRFSDDKLIVENPSKETYGSDFDYILKIAFDIEYSISERSLEELKTLQKSRSIPKIEEKIEEFGDSAEKLFLFKHLEDLKARKK